MLIIVVIISSLRVYVILYALFLLSLLDWINFHWYTVIVLEQIQMIDISLIKLRNGKVIRRWVLKALLLFNSEKTKELVLGSHAA